jgi:hypothetical protein
MWVSQACRFCGGFGGRGLWCTDYKGEFLLANRQYCYPLTVRKRR